VNKHIFELFIAKDFAKTLQDEFIMYILIMYNIIKELTVEHQVKIQNNIMSCIIYVFEIQILFIELKEYKNVFLTESINRLSLHEEHDHAIETTAELLYDLLYN